MRGCILVAYSFSALLVGCGGGGKKPVNTPSDDTQVKDTGPKPETEADRENKRRAAAAAIIPEGSSCLPVALKEENAPRLELAAVGKDAIVCAIDQQPDRLLGIVGCWKVDLASGKLDPKAAEPLPGRGYAVLVDDKCARGFCLPNAPKSNVVFMAHSLDGSKVAVLADDQVHIFKADGKTHESSFSVRGDKGVTNEPKAVHYVGDAILVEGADQGPYSAVWVFKADGTQVGPITMLGAKEEKPLSTYHGSFSILDKTRVAIGYHGMETLNTYDVTNGARAKLVRKPGKLACKPAELDAFWVDGDKVTDKCKVSIEKDRGHLEGATVVAGAKNFLVLLRGPRLGELAVMDAKTLAEKSVIKMSWCGTEGAAGGSEADKAPVAEKAAAAAPPAAASPPADKGAAKKKATTRGAAPAADSADPQEGGE
jgi:hypothetical protein